jgi:hypothetical protein
MRLIPLRPLTRTCDNFEDMELHRTTEHAEDFFGSCHLCGKEYYSETSFKKHMEAHETQTEGVFKCLNLNCKKTLSVPLDFMTHTKQHSRVNHECDVPNCTFLSKSHRALQFHKASVHSIWLQHCQVCSEGFDRSRDLKQHMNVHENAEPGVIKCTGDLKKHMETHNNESSQVGNDSDSSLDTTLIERIIQEETAVHEQETDNSSYQKSEQIFNSTAFLKKLTPSLTGQRPFSCDHPGCNVTTTTKNALTSHKNEEHTIKS